MDLVEDITSAIIKKIRTIRLQITKNLPNILVRAYLFAFTFFLNTNAIAQNAEKREQFSLQTKRFFIRTKIMTFFAKINLIKIRNKFFHICVKT